MSQQSYPSTRAKTQALPTINSISLCPIKKEARFPLFKVLVNMSIAVGVLATCNGTDRTNGHNPTGPAEPDLGTMYDCEVTSFDGVYALPDPLGYTDTTKLTEVQSFNAEILQYKPKKAHMYIYQCILTILSHICNENALWQATLSTKTVEMPISVRDWLLSAKMNNYNNTALNVDPKGPDTRKSPMRKKRHCPWNRYTHYDEKILQILRYNARLEGDDIHVFQDLTETRCVLKDLS